MARKDPARAFIENQQAIGADAERRRIRAAQAKALQELRAVYKATTWQSIRQAIRTIESATRASRRAKRSAGKGGS